MKQTSTVKRLKRMFGHNYNGPVIRIPYGKRVQIALFEKESNEEIKYKTSVYLQVAPYEEFYIQTFNEVTNQVFCYRLEQATYKEVHSIATSFSEGRLSVWPTPIS